MSVVVRDERVEVETTQYPNGEHDDHITLMALGRALATRGFAIECCGSCSAFRQSGMSRQMSGGAAGYCTRVGYRSTQAMVSIEHRCGEHEGHGGWTDDNAWSMDELDRRHGEVNRQGRVAAFEGAIVGLAVGDALGYPCEFRRRAHILEAFGPDGVTDFVAVHDPRWGGRPMILGPEHPPGTYTDDTQMSLAVAEALIEAGAEPLLELMDRMARRFVQWSKSPDNDRAPGSACMTGCANLARGLSWRASGVSDSKGAGAPMRVVPIGLRYFRDRGRLLEVARASSLPTHGHDAAVESAAAVALATALALEKRTPAEMLEAIEAECAPRSRDLAAALRKVPKLLDADPAHALSAAGLGESWVAEELVACALWCLTRHPGDYRAAVLAAANTDGDSDTLACVVGGIAGALHGVGAIPRAWRDGVENEQALVDVGQRLHAITFESP